MSDTDRVSELAEAISRDYALYVAAMRRAAPSSAFLIAVLVGCGSSEAAPAPTRDDAVGRTANAILKTLHDKDAAGVCQLFPPNLVKYVGGMKECIRVQEENFRSAGSPENGRIRTVDRLRPRPGRIESVVDVRRFARYRTDPFAYRGPVWTVLITGGVQVTPRSGDFLDIENAELVRAEGLARRGIQCVTVSRTPAGLRATWDVLCEDYVARRRPQFEP